MSFDYLNREGSRIARPERAGCEIRPSTQGSGFTALDSLSIATVVQADCCTVLLLGSIKEARALRAIRVREAFVRGLFRGESTLSSSSVRFPNLIPTSFTSFACRRCARRSATSCLRVVASVAFCTLLASRIACLSAFSCASCSRTICRAIWRCSFFSSTSRAFLALEIAS